MDVFFSWSGQRSKELAMVFRKWLPVMIQSVKPYFSPEDIEKGAKWGQEISTKLNDCQYGIIFVTPENRTAPWLLFEAGAIAKEVSNSRVCPIIFHLTPAEISGPLSLLQLTVFEKKEIKKLINGLNHRLGELGLSQETLDQSFEMFWPKLEDETTKILNIKVKDAPAAKRTDREILEEILELSRQRNVESKKLESQKPSDSRLRSVLFKTLNDFKQDEIETSGHFRNLLINSSIPHYTYKEVEPTVLNEIEPGDPKDH